MTTVGNADRADYDKSTLVIYGEPKQATVDALMTRVWHLARIASEPSRGEADKDIAVIVGSDQSVRPQQK